MNAEPFQECCIVLGNIFVPSFHKLLWIFTRSSERTICFMTPNHPSDVSNFKLFPSSGQHFCLGKLGDQDEL